MEMTRRVRQYHRIRYGIVEVTADLLATRGSPDSLLNRDGQKSVLESLKRAGLYPMMAESPFEMFSFVEYGDLALLQCAGYIAGLAPEDLYEGSLGAFDSVQETRDAHHAAILFLLENIPCTPEIDVATHAAVEHYLKNGEAIDDSESEEYTHFVEWTDCLANLLQKIGEARLVQTMNGVYRRVSSAAVETK